MNPDMHVRIVGTGANPDGTVRVVGDQVLDITGSSDGDVVQVSGETLVTGPVSVDTPVSINGGTP